MKIKTGVNYFEDWFYKHCNNPKYDLTSSKVGYIGCFNDMFPLLNELREALISTREELSEWVGEVGEDKASITAIEKADNALGNLEKWRGL